MPLFMLFVLQAILLSFVTPTTWLITVFTSSLATLVLTLTTWPTGTSALPTTTGPSSGLWATSINANGWRQVGVRGMCIHTQSTIFPTVVHIRAPYGYWSTLVLIYIMQWILFPTRHTPRFKFPRPCWKTTRDHAFAIWYFNKEENKMPTVCTGYGCIIIAY